QRGLHYVRRESQWAEWQLRQNGDFCEWYEGATGPMIMDEEDSDWGDRDDEHRKKEYRFEPEDEEEDFEEDDGDVWEHSENLEEHDPTLQMFHNELKKTRDIYGDDSVQGRELLLNMQEYSNYMQGKSSQEDAKEVRNPGA